MADVSIFYKGETIAQMDTTDSKTLKTSGCYCEGDVTVEYAPRSHTYEITLAKASGGVLLTTLDDDVLAHINDDNLIVSLINSSPYVYEWYAGDTYFCGNRKIGVAQGGYDIFGVCNRHQSESGTAATAIPTPANNTEVMTQPLSVFAGLFYLEDKKYYMKPGDGFIRAGTYRLTFTW